MNLNKNKLKKIISYFKSKKILIIGDLILDRHVFGSVNRISPEAPVPVVWAKDETFRAGGAANVAMNLVNLGAQVGVCGTTGEDNFGQKLAFLLKAKKINTSLIFKDKKRKTTLKTRIIAHHQQVARIDWESPNHYSLKNSEAIWKKIKSKIDAFDAIIIEDYGKGMINPFLVKRLVQFCRKKKKIITVDPKEDHFCYYKNVTALSPNLAEAQVAAGMKIKNKGDLKKIGKKIIKDLNPQCLLLTLGEEGMLLFEKTKIKHIPTAALEVYDVTGAGDTVIAVFTLSVLAGASFFESAQIANLAAGSVISKLGAVPVEKKELLEIINEKGN